MTAKATQLLYLKPAQLRTHPKNLRRFYPEHQVREMADSIKACGGVLQPLRIVANGKSGRYFVVDGNMRLAGARALGADCPELKCELVEESEAEQLLAMVVTAKLRYDPDPISEALHYQRLIQEEGYSVPRIAAATGISNTIIYQHLRWLELEPEIQALVAEGRLPRDAHVADAFLSIDNAAARVKLAQRLARDGVGLRAIKGACARAVELLKHPPEDEAGARKTTPSLALARQRTKEAPVPQVLDHEAVRLSAFHVCASCEIKAAQFPRVAEPAWETVSHAAGDVCQNCNVRQVKTACSACPLVDFLRRLIASAQSSLAGGAA